MSIIQDGKMILLLSPFFYPEAISTGKYNTYLAKALKKHGHNIRVIASYPLYPDWVPSKTQEKINGIDIVRGGLGVRYPRSQVIKRIILEFWYSFFVARNIIRYRKDIDIVIAIFPPVIFMIFANILMPRKVARVGIVHDLLGVMAKSDNKLSRRIISKMIKMVETYSLRKCNQVVCLSNSMRNVVISNYGIDSRR